MKTKKQISAAPLLTARTSRDYAEHVIQLQAVRGQGMLAMGSAFEAFQAAYLTNSSHWFQLGLHHLASVVVGLWRVYCRATSRCTLLVCRN
ncbi:hypothetical protein [Hydrogenophaga sp.]|uniref:hypothetical protein n=1 Tax=Hydrogenophaga sp. TaxID=1904254 RepID=UPI00262D51A4|nr:hypothetical protein [Hydrogenophaga sp.]MDM7950913.1 hypothetical protein [Hydrogenophaga sp.]